MKESKLATILALAALDDSAIKSLEERVNELAELGFKPEIVEELPESGNDHTLYLVPQNEPGENPWYKEYLWLQNEWENIGTTSINFENYYTKDEIDAIDVTKEDISNKITSLNSESTDVQYPSAKAVWDLFGTGNLSYIEKVQANTYTYAKPFVLEDKKLGIYFIQRDASFAIKGRNSESPTEYKPTGIAGMPVILIYNKHISTIDGNSGNLGITFYRSQSNGRLMLGNLCYYQGKIYLGADSGAPQIVPYFDFLFEGAQTFQGVKTFSSLPVSTPVPTQDGQLTNKKYVDDAIAASDTPTITIDADVLNNIITSTDVNKVLDSIESNKSFNLLVHSNFMDFTSPAEVKSTGADPNKTYYIETIMNGMIVSTDTLVRDQDCTIYKDELEFTSHKVTSLSNASTDTQYPSAKAVWDLIGSLNKSAYKLFDGRMTYTHPEHLKLYANLDKNTLYINKDTTLQNPVSYSCYEGTSTSTDYTILYYYVFGDYETAVNNEIIGYGVGFGMYSEGTKKLTSVPIKIVEQSSGNRWVRFTNDVVVGVGELLDSRNNYIQTINGTKKFTKIPEVNSYTAPTQDTQLTAKKYVDDKISTTAIQYTTMPTASADYLDKIIQYTGTTDSTYTNGYFYIGVSDGATEPTYSWERIAVQPEPDMSNYLAKDNTVSYIPTGQYNPSTKGYVDNYFFKGSETDWDLLTPQQQAAYAVAVVSYGFYDLTEEDEANLSSIIGSEEPIESDMTEEEGIALTNQIIGGNE